MYIVFVATELDPVIPGGAGAVIAGVGERLIAAGHRVEVLLVGTPPDETGNEPGLPVTWVEPGTPDWRAPDQHQANARAAAEALAALDESPDLVEFQDFNGLGSWALMRRVSLGLSGVPMTVRLHGPIDLVHDRVGIASDLEPVLRAMEREALRMADAVVAPSTSMAAVVADRYGVEPDRIRIGEPPVPQLVLGSRRPAPHPEIVCYGRLGEQKGSEDLVRAAIPLLEAHAEMVLRFVGPDGWRIADGRSMAAHLRGLIPESVSDRVRFEPAIERERLAVTLESAWLAVFPSRFETFCLAAHECRLLGVPVLVPQLPEFEPFFSARTGALVYDSTVEGLQSSLAEAIEHPELLASLSDAPAPSYRDPLEVYTPLSTRHSRTQSGLATAALRRIEAAGHRLEQPPPALAALTDRVLDGLPEALARRLEAGPLDTSAIRRWRRRRQAGSWEREWMEATWGRDQASPAEPDVSVVIPCYNQGEFLHAAIRSVFRQDYRSWEIIVVDDGSTDPNTRAVLRSLHYPRTRLIRQRNQGLSAARNTGMRAARGRFLVPLDSDDELGTSFLSSTIEALADRPRVGFAHTWTRLFGNQKLIWIDRPYNPYQLLLSTSVVGCALIRAEAWQQVGGYDTDRRRGNEDWDLWIRLLEAGWEQVEVPRPLFRYRQHGISMSVTTEARFEDARREIALAHPGLYEPAALRAMKADWYPWVSVVVDAGIDPELLRQQTLDDLELVVVGEPTGEITAIAGARGWPMRSGGSDLRGGVHAARGKFLIDWRPVADAGPELLEELAALLEDDQGAYAASVEAGCHPTLWRRWSLLDPAAGPDRLAKAGTRGAGPPLDESDYRGAFPHPRWSIDPERFPLEVYRVRPETEGRFPDWLP
ncbi:MAG: glycosyltransferase [Acidimicrobiia bacterium]